MSMFLQSDGWLVTKNKSDAFFKGLHEHAVSGKPENCHQKSTRREGESERERERPKIFIEYPYAQQDLHWKIESSNFRLVGTMLPKVPIQNNFPNRSGCILIKFG